MVSGTEDDLSVMHIFGQPKGTVAKALDQTHKAGFRVQGSGFRVQGSGFRV